MRTFDRSSLPSDVIRIAETIARHQHHAWVVGGCVRDVLMGRAAKDWDLATTAHPHEVQKMFRRVVPTGIQHGTVTVVLGGTGYEVTTLRGEGAYTDGRRPDSVHFVGTIEEDLARRDFTVNAIAFDPVGGVLVDPWKGCVDLERGVLRAVGDARERFSEDGLRALRAARFVATLEMDLDPATEAAIPGALDTFAKVSAERVHDEWEKACRAARPSRAFVVMRRTGMLSRTAPMLDALSAEAFERSLARMDRAPATLAMRVGALFAEVKVPRASLDAWLRELRFSGPDRERVLLLHAHAEIDLAALTPFERRRLVARCGIEDALALVALARADLGARGLPDVAQAVGEAIEADRAARVPTATRELAVTGHDLMRELGMAPGRELGRILEALLDAVLEDPSRNERATLLARAASAAAPKLERP